MFFYDILAFRVSSMNLILSVLMHLLPHPMGNHLQLVFDRFNSNNKDAITYTCVRLYKQMQRVQETYGWTAVEEELRYGSNAVKFIQPIIKAMYGCTHARRDRRCVHFVRLGDPLPTHKPATTPFIA
jgi:hypothetical protein